VVVDELRYAVDQTKNLSVTSSVDNKRLPVKVRRGKTGTAK